MIILDRPDARHIPWFAMGVPSSLEDRAADIDIEAGLDQTGLSGGDVPIGFALIAATMQSDLVATRNFIEPRTALYVHWLLFRDDTLATQFLEAFPKYQFEKRIERIRRERQLLTERLEQRLKTRRVRPQPAPENHRWTVATRYVEAHDKIADLDVGRHEELTP